MALSVVTHVTFRYLYSSKLADTFRLNFTNLSKEPSSSIEKKLYFFECLFLLFFNLIVNLYFIQSKFSLIYCVTLYKWTVYTVHCVHTFECLYSVQFTLHSAHCTSINQLFQILYFLERYYNE